MTVVATFCVDEGGFAIGDAFAGVIDADVEAESIVPMSGADLPYFWLEGSADEQDLATLTEDPRVESVTVADSLATRQLLRIDWAVEDDDLVTAIVDTGAVVLRANRDGNRWRVRLRFEDHDALSAFNRRCLDEDIDIDLEQIHNPGGVGRDHGYDLTPEQKEVLMTAIEEGYFEVPRETTLVELGERLGISDSAVSQRIRRGLETLLHETLLADPGEDDSPTPE